MYFKSIEMRGFKSFVDETKVVFEPGVTAIVGPNGCGKSNIADAVRWVLGEQSPKLMRGAKMEDFIFTGSSARKPTSFAEVSITISNDDGGITVAPYSEYEEITVKRKLYRSGESEYYLNQVPCRLKDVVDVFLDTGLSTRSFSIIEQGQVTRIVNSKPEDRRFIIEEAAGVMKYKNRKNAAMNKLASSQQNLLRIQDILGELEKQRNSLNRQAKKAERFRTYRTEIKEKGLAHYADLYQRLTAQLAEVEEGLVTAKNRETEVSARLSTRRNEREVTQTEITTEERKAGDLKEERYTKTTAIEKNEHTSNLFATQLTELAEAQRNAVEEKGKLAKELEEVKRSIEAREAEADRLTQNIEKGKEQEASFRAEKERINSHLTEREGRLAEAARKDEEITAAIGEKESKKAEGTARLEMAGDRLTTILGNEGELSAKIEESTKSGAALAAVFGEKQAQLATEKSAITELKQKLETLEAEYATAREIARSTEEEKTRLTSKLESLEELEKNREGYGEGVKNLLRFKKENVPAASFAGSLLADKLAIPAEYERAVAAYLGEKLEAFMATDADSAKDALLLLKEKGAGSISVIANDIAPQEKSHASPPDHESLIGSMADVVGSNLPPQAVALFNGVWLVKTLADAIEIWKTNPGAFCLVTTDGEVIERSGLVTGGSRGQGGASIVARKRMIEDLGKNCAEASEKAKKTDLTAKELLANVDSIKEQLKTAEASLRVIELAVIEKGQEVKRVEEEKERDTKAVTGFSEEREKIEAEKRELMTELALISRDFQALAQNRADRKKASLSSREEIESLRTAAQSADGQLRKEEMGLAEERAKRENANLDKKRLESGKIDLETRIEKHAESTSDAGVRSEELKSAIESMNQDNNVLVREKDDLTATIRELSEKLEEKRESLEGLEEAIGELTEEMENARAGVSDLAVKKSECAMRIENTTEKADNEFNIPLEDLEVADLSSVDMEEVDRRLSHLRQELGRIGDVNMSALDEFEEVDSRYTNMKTQRDDLVVSIANLRKTIDSISSTTNRMFNEAFRDVSANFEKIFQRLFGGGKAEMILVHEEGKDEPGVEIIVAPPGKKTQNLNLLSAGEKAMTAIALLFAVFLKQPSPFCLLDEVDAPLDEANILRFRDMLMEMKGNTQFVIITHSQKTMSFAERLYGVTQEEEGVSKILAVDLVDHRHEDFSMSAA